MRDLREMGVDARCRVRYDEPQPTLCVTARPSIVRNLEISRSRWRHAGVPCTPSFAFLDQAFPGPRTKPQEGFGFSPVSARRVQGTQPANAMIPTRRDHHFPPSPRVARSARLVPPPSERGVPRRGGGSTPCSAVPERGRLVRPVPSAQNLAPSSPSSRSVSRRVAENARDAEAPPRPSHLLPLSSSLSPLSRRTDDIDKIDEPPPQ